MLSVTELSIFKTVLSTEEGKGERELVKGNVDDISSDHFAQIAQRSRLFKPFSQKKWWKYPSFLNLKIDYFYVVVSLWKWLYKMEKRESRNFTSTVPLIYFTSTVPLIYFTSTVPLIYFAFKVPLIYFTSTVPLIYFTSTAP